MEQDPEATERSNERGTSWRRVGRIKRKRGAGVKGEARPLTLAGLRDPIRLLAKLLHP